MDEKLECDNKKWISLFKWYNRTIKHDCNKFKYSKSVILIENLPIRENIDVNIVVMFIINGDTTKKVYNTRFY